MLLNEGMFLSPCLCVVRCGEEENSGVLVVVMVGEPPSEGQFHMWCLAVTKLFEFGLAVELAFVDANVCTADVVVASLMVSAV